MSYGIYLAHVEASLVCAMHELARSAFGPGEVPDYLMLDGVLYRCRP